jgi:hypothetical protein
MKPAWGRRLGQARIGMLALSGGRYPLVNPAAFHYSSGCIWITTSRSALKVARARREPRAAFAVGSGRGGSLLFQGWLETYDPRVPEELLKAAFDPFRVAWSMAGYTLKNAPFVGGYLLELAAVPRQWWPHNRALLRLHEERSAAMSMRPAPSGKRITLPGVPPPVARVLESVRQAYLCWRRGPDLALAPAWWAVEAGEVFVWLPAVPSALASGGSGMALVVERHHAYRATQAVGACLRGIASVDPDAEQVLEARYDSPLPPGGSWWRLRPELATWWEGFEIATRALVSS